MSDKPEYPRRLIDVNLAALEARASLVMIALDARQFIDATERGDTTPVVAHFYTQLRETVERLEKFLNLPPLAKDGMSTGRTRSDRPNTPFK